MRKIAILAVLILLLSSAAPAAAIVGGEPDGDGHPNVGKMIADIGGTPAWSCSGTLIAPQVFLTAGHCVGDGAEAARVWFESDLTDNPDYPFGGPTAYEGIPVPHPLYSWGDADPHDVGLVILDEAVTGIEPASLPGPDLLTQLKKDRVLEGGSEPGVYFRSVGYGGVLESWPPPVIVYDRIRRTSVSEYAALTQSRLHLFQRAVFEEGGSCFGDSGGPIFYTDAEGDEIVVAVTSSGDAQCVATGIDYRVDVPEILDWIKSYLPPEG